MGKAQPSGAGAAIAPACTKGIARMVSTVCARAAHDGLSLH